VILTDDLEMKALAASYTVADSAIGSIQAGCDGVLICRHLSSERGQDIEVQATALEALVHAVEDERIPYKRLEDALARHRRAKERFLAAPVVQPPAGRTALRQVLGSDEHRRVAEEMARYL
jgi:beta-N-acetylhexosaminidase